LGVISGEDGGVDEADRFILIAGLN
jgi:hypothetical protein